MTDLSDKENPNLEDKSQSESVESPKVWKQRLTSEVEEAAKRWPLLYKFNYSEERRNFFFNRFAEHYKSSLVTAGSDQTRQSSSLEKAYHATLYAFDVLIPENVALFMSFEKILWYYRRSIPYLPTLTEVRELSPPFSILLEQNVAPEFFAKCVRASGDSFDCMVAAYLKYGAGNWIEEILTRMEDDAIDHNVYAALQEVVREPEIKALIYPKLLAKTLGTLKLAAQNVRKAIDNGKSNPADLKNHYWEYVIFPFECQLPLQKRSWYQILRALKGNLIPQPNAVASAKIPLIKIGNQSDEGIDELVFYLVNQDDPELVETVLKCIRAEEKEDVENEQQYLLGELMDWIRPGSKLFPMVSAKLHPSYPLAGTIGFQNWYALYSKDPQRKFHLGSDSGIYELVKILYPDYEEEHSEYTHSSNEGSRSCSEDEQEKGEKREVLKEKLKKKLNEKKGHKCLDENCKH